MAIKKDLDTWIVEILRKNGPAMNYIEIAKNIWQLHESELRISGNLFYTWQYDMRWAGNRLRRAGILQPAEESPTGMWELI